MGGRTQCTPSLYGYHEWGLYCRIHVASADFTLQFLSYLNENVFQYSVDVRKHGIMPRERFSNNDYFRVLIRHNQEISHLVCVVCA